MTPKDKAENLVSLFTFNCKECDNAKISALFAVEQIISELGFSIEIDYWNEVKKEIMKR